MDLPFYTFRQESGHVDGLPALPRLHTRAAAFLVPVLDTDVELLRWTCLAGRR